MQDHTTNATAPSAKAIALALRKTANCLTSKAIVKSFSMRVTTVNLTLAELQDALREYCAHRCIEPDVVSITSYDKYIVVELVPNGLVTCNEFSHRASPK